MTDPRRRPHPRRNAEISRAYEDLEAVVPEQPVRRMAHPANDDGRPEAIVVYLALMLLVILGACVYLAAPRSGPSVSPPADQSSAPSSVPHSDAVSVTDDPPVALLPGQGGVTDPGAPIVASSPTRYGVATYCAPTPRYCRGWGGRAMLGAVPSFRFGDDRYQAEVCAFRGGSTSCVVVTVVSFCGCGDRHGKPTLIDLSPAAFRQLAPLSLGVVDVSVRRIDGTSVPRGTLPPTDVAP